MLDKFLVLLERFVVAHELIAANSAKHTVIEKVGEVIRAEEQVAKLCAEEAAPTDALKELMGRTRLSAELPVEGETVIDTPAAEEKPKRSDALNRKPKAAKKEPLPQDDLADEEPEEKKPAKKEVDLTPLRDDIKVMAKHIAAGESDKCADLFDELLEEYGVRTVTKLPDDVVSKFHKDAKALVAKYYDLED